MSAMNVLHGRLDNGDGPGLYCVVHDGIQTVYQASGVASYPFAVSDGEVLQLRWDGSPAVGLPAAAHQEGRWFADLERREAAGE